MFTSLGIPIDRYWHDYIKDPKINGYQSIHTAVLRGETIFRFQVRTREMQSQSQEGVLYNAYDADGKFHQPNIPWLKTDWLKLLFAVRDRRDKVVLVKSLAQAALTSLMVKTNGETKSYDVLLPRGVTPLEAAFIADPELGLTVVGATYQDAACDLNKPLEGSIGILRLESGDEQPRDYMALLMSPLARLRFVEYMAGKDEASRFKFAGQNLGEALAKYYLGLDELLAECPKLVNATIARIVTGEITTAAGASELNEAVKKANDGSLMIARLSFETGRATAGSLLTMLKEAFPIESGGFIGDRVRVSIPIKHGLMVGQLKRATQELEQDDEAVVIESDIVRPPLIQDHTVFSPDSFNFSRDLALRASRALRQQKVAFEISLGERTGQPEALGIYFHRGIEAALVEHLEQAGIIFIGGEKDDVSRFYEAISEFLAIKSAPEPLVVFYERNQSTKLETIAQPLTQIEASFPLNLIDSPTSADLVFTHLLRRFDRETRGRSF